MHGKKEKVFNKNKEGDYNDTERKIYICKRAVCTNGS